MKKSVCIETIFTEVPFEDRFKLVEESGFEYIEFWSWEDKNIEKIKELCEKHHLKIASFSGDKTFSLIDNNEKELYIEYIKASIKTAKYLNCSNLVIHSNALGEGGIVVNDYRKVSDFDKFSTAYDILKTLAPISEESQINLVLEALNTFVDHDGNYLAYTSDSAKLVKMINSDYIKILYDVYHMQIMEGNIIDNIHKYIDYIGYIHIADVPGRHEPGTGEINFINVFYALSSLTYDGFIGFELFPTKESSIVASELLNL